jgi:uncharacterized protein (TIGR03118 family)
LEDRCLLSTGFIQTNLVSDTPGLAQVTDPNLVNPWGIAASPGGPFWVADNNAGVSTLYSGTTQPQSSADSLVVGIPGLGTTSTQASGAPTGTVFNGGSGFIITANGVSAPSVFLFATEDGTISGWNPFVAPNQAIVTVPAASTTSGGIAANFKGLAVGDTGGGTFLYATNFRAGTIDVLNQDFQAVHLSGSFSDPGIPTGFAPFGIQNIGGMLYVTYAKQDAAGYDNVDGPGNGFIDVFNTSGTLLRRFVSQGPLDSPWGLTQAPADFGQFSNDLLVGNLGDGRINAFDPHTGAFVGPLTDANGAALTIPGLWGLAFGSGGSGGGPDTLFFTAGIQDQEHGLFGKIQTPESFLAEAAAGPAPQQSFYHPDSTPDGGQQDNYPIPPAGGPALRGDLVPATEPAAVLLALADAPLALVPTFLTSSASGPDVAANTGPVSKAGVPDAPGATASQGSPFQQNRTAALSRLLDLNPLTDAPTVQTVHSVEKPGHGAAATADVQQDRDDFFLTAESSGGLLQVDYERLQAAPAGVWSVQSQAGTDAEVLPALEQGNLESSPVSVHDVGKRSQASEKTPADSRPAQGHEWIKLVGIFLLVSGAHLAWLPGTPSPRRVVKRLPDAEPGSPD